MNADGSENYDGWTTLSLNPFHTPTLTPSSISRLTAVPLVSPPPLPLTPRTSPLPSLSLALSQCDTLPLHI